MTRARNQKCRQGLLTYLCLCLSITAAAQSDSTHRSETLEEVSVTARQQRKASEHIARLPIANLENPQAYNIVPKELLKEQVTVSFDDAVKNIPGLTRLWTATGRAGDGAGYYAMRGFSVQPTMINGVAGITNGSIDPASIERIEGIKGPSGTLFGSSLISFGGLLNIVTKKPFKGSGGEITYTAGSYGLNRVTADLNLPLNRENTALFRVNTAYHYEASFHDAGFRRSFFIAPSLSFAAGSRLSFLVNAEYYNGEGTNPLSVFLNRSRQLIARNPEELGLDFSRSYTSNGLTIRTPSLNLNAQMSYKLSAFWTAQTNVSRSVRNTDGYYAYLMFLDAGMPAGQYNDTLLSRFVSDQTSVTTTTQLQQNVTGDMKLLGMRNRLVAGIDFLQILTQNNNSPYVSDLVSAVRRNDPRYGLFSRQIVDGRIAAGTAAYARTTVNSYTYSAYLSDVLNITPTTLAMLSLRVDHFDSKGTVNHNTGVTTGAYKQNTLSPKFGLVQQLLGKRLAVFANYMNGFRNVAPVTQPLPELNGSFNPQQANQIEAGIKLDAADHRITFMASYYDILVSNMTRSATYVKGDTSYNYTVQDGSQRSRGVELDLIANPVRGLNIVAGYGYNDSRMEKADKHVEGRRPVTAGPEHLANFWISYNITRGTIKGLGAGFGGNYASENIVTNDLRTGTFTLPSYTVFGASVFYETGKYRLALKLDNLTNQDYYIGWTTVEKQMPRRASASVSFKF